MLYAVDEASPHHELSRSWLDGCLAGNEAVGFAWVALLAFVRLATNPSIFPHPLTSEEALSQVETWLAAPAATLIEPGVRHAGRLRELLGETGTGGNLTMDAHLAAMALENRAEIVSFDRDFGRFHGVRHRRPG